MIDTLRSRLLAVRVCLLAMALQVLSPLAVCLASTSVDALIAAQVCAVPDADGGMSAEGAPAEHRPSSHCPICSLHTPAISGPAPAGFASGAAPLDDVPHLFLQAPRRLFAWIIAPSRAPPLSV